VRRAEIGLREHLSDYPRKRVVDLPEVAGHFQEIELVSPEGCPRLETGSLGRIIVKVLAVDPVLKVLVRRDRLADRIASLID
jgi:hypothetical protein